LLKIADIDWILTSLLSVDCETLLGWMSLMKTLQNDHDSHRLSWPDPELSTLKDVGNLWGYALLLKTTATSPGVSASPEA